MIDRNVFASDNASGLCPAAWDALQSANASGCMLSYGEDPFTKQACDQIRALFECEAEVFFVFTGTAANALALTAICQGHHAVICHEKSHVMTDECGAVEGFTGGARLLGCSGDHAKLTPDQVLSRVRHRRDVHSSKPSALSLTQATEFGTVYSIDELSALCGCAHDDNLKVHLDGARFANAVVHLGVSPAEASWKAGVDVMSFGLAKLGAGLGEAVVFFDRQLAHEFDYRCKHAAQLASKMRVITAPWCGLLQDDVWRGIARDVNRRAQDLRARLQGLPRVELLFPTQANAVFARFPPLVNDAMHAKGWHYYELAGIADSRLMCSWATTSEHIDAFTSDLKQSLSGDIVIE